MCHPTTTEKEKNGIDYTVYLKMVDAVNCVKSVSVCVSDTDERGAPAEKARTMYGVMLHMYSRACVHVKMSTQR